MSGKCECKKYFYVSYLKHEKREAVLSNFNASWSNICWLLVLIYYKFISQNTKRESITLKLTSETRKKYRFMISNKHSQIDTLHFHYHFIEVQSLEMFRALLAHHQETLHKCSVVDYCVPKFVIS
jgi:hypothetical protein